MAYKVSENKRDFYNVLQNLTFLTEQVLHDPLFEPSLEETKQIDDIALRLMDILTVSEYNN